MRAAHARRRKLRAIRYLSGRDGSGVPRGLHTLEPGLQEAPPRQRNIIRNRIPIEETSYKRRPLVRRARPR